MKRFYAAIKTRIEKDLNEYIKWVILIGLYLFYRMMEKAYDESQLTFLVIPLVFLAILVFISDWIIDYLVISCDKTEATAQRPVSISRIIGGLFYLSIIFLLLFYIFEWFPLINMGIFCLLSTAIAARAQDVRSNSTRPGWNITYAIILVFVGLSGIVHALFLNNYLNFLTFIFYVGGIIYYFLNLYLFVKVDQKSKGLKAE
jgi:hypothetical protein